MVAAPVRFVLLALPRALDKVASGARPACRLLLTTLMLAAIVTQWNATTRGSEAPLPEEAARVLDLRTFSRPADALPSSVQTLGMLMYETPGDATAAYDFQRKQLTAAGWKEQPGGYHAAANHSGEFRKDGYTLSVSSSESPASAEKPAGASVALINHGNIAGSELPVPKNVTPFHSQAGNAAYLTDAKPEETATACRQLLIDSGWRPYGAIGDPSMPMMYFKKHAIRLMLWVAPAPAQANKTMLRYSTELLSADLPLPPTAPDPRYNDSDKSLRFEWPGEDGEPVVEFYQTELPKLGWKPTTEQPISDDREKEQLLIFRNPEGDLISLDLQKFTGMVRVKVQHETAAEFAAHEAQAKAAAEKFAQERAAAEKLAQSKAPKPSPVGKMPELPDTDDVGALLKAAQKMADDAIDEAKAEVSGKSPAAAGKKKPVAAGGVISVGDIPIPSGAGSTYQKITKMIQVLSPSSVSELSKSFLESLEERGWELTQKPLITDDSAILKFSQGAATLTIMATGKDGESQATIMCGGLNWDSVPPNRVAWKPDAAKSAVKSPSGKSPAGKPAMNSESESDSDSDTSADAALRYAAKISPAEQKQTGATITAGGKQIKLAYGVAYQAVDDDETSTLVLLSAKPINVDKVVALLNSGRDGGDALGFDPNMKLRFGPDGKLNYVFLYADGLSVNLSGQGEDKLASEMTLDADRARGKAVLLEPGKLFDNEYRFDVSFNTKLIASKSVNPQSGDNSPSTGDEPLGAEEHDGLPYPLITQNRSTTSSPFRNTGTATIPAPLKSVVDFYRRELSQRGWKEDTQAAKLTDSTAELSFSGAEGTAEVKLAKDASSEQPAINATVSVRNAARAKAAGILPQPGKGRLILGNASQRETTIVINGQPYKVPAGRGAKNPQDGISLHVLPGNYNCSIPSPGKPGAAASKPGEGSPGKPEASEKLKIAIGETWGIIVLPTGGYFADQVY